MSERFYTNYALELGPFELDGPEAHHLAAVCRLRPGDLVCLFNGNGFEYPAQVVEVAKKRVSLLVLECKPVHRELARYVEVAAPLPKGDRTQFLVEKLTEFGVTAFTPLLCERSVIHPKESTLEKLRRYVIEASKQCGRNVLMRIAPAVHWTDYAAPRSSGLTPDRQVNEARLFAHPGINEKPSFIPKASRCVVGPEGGFTSDEVDLALRHGWHVADLGPRILRIETAALALALKAIGM